MKAWRIHFVWSILAALAVAITARMASRPEPIPMREAAPAKEPVVATPETAPVAAVPAVVGEPEAPLPLPPSPVSEEDRLRQLLAATKEHRDFIKIFEGISDRAVKLKLLREAACGKDQMSCYAALQVLQGMKGRDVAEILEACLAIHHDQSQGGYAAQILGHAGDALSYPPLTEGLRSTNEEVRVSCAESLMTLGYPTASQDMAVAYTRQFQSSDGALRRKSVESLARLDLQGSVAVFTQALKDSNGDVRLEALNAFSSLEKKEYLPLLEPLLHDPNPDVAREAKNVVKGLKAEEDN